MAAEPSLCLARLPRSAAPLPPPPPKSRGRQQQQLLQPSLSPLGRALSRSKAPTRTRLSFRRRWRHRRPFFLLPGSSTTARGTSRPRGRTRCSRTSCRSKGAAAAAASAAAAARRPCSPCGRRPRRRRCSSRGSRPWRRRPRPRSRRSGRCSSGSAALSLLLPSPSPGLPFPRLPSQEVLTTSSLFPSRVPRGEWRCEAEEEVDGERSFRRRRRPSETTAAARQKNACRFRASLSSRGGSDAEEAQQPPRSGRPLSPCLPTRRALVGRTLQSSPRRSLLLLLLLLLPLRQQRRRRRRAPLPRFFFFAPCPSTTLLPPLSLPLRARSDRSTASTHLSTATTSMAPRLPCGASTFERPKSRRREKGAPPQQRPRRPTSTSTSSGGAPPPRSAPPRSPLLAPLPPLFLFPTPNRNFRLLPLLSTNSSGRFRNRSPPRGRGAGRGG